MDDHSDILGGIMGKQNLREFTSVGAVPAVEGPLKKVTFKAPIKKRPYKTRSIREDASIFPDDAEVATSSNANTDAIAKDQVKPEVPPIPEDEPLIPTSMALVAPDATPDWYKPIKAEDAPTETKEGKPAAGALDFLLARDPDAANPAAEAARIQAMSKPASTTPSSPEIPPSPYVEGTQRPSLPQHQGKSSLSETLSKLHGLI